MGWTGGLPEDLWPMLPAEGGQRWRAPRPCPALSCWASPSWIRRKGGVLFHSHCLRKPGDVWMDMSAPKSGGRWGGGRAGLEGRGGNGDPRKLDLE